MSKFSFMSGDEILPLPDQVSADQLQDSIGTVNPAYDYVPLQIMQNGPLRIDQAPIDILMQATRLGRPSVPFIVVTPEDDVRMPLNTSFNGRVRFDRSVTFNDESVFNGRADFTGPVSFNGPVTLNGRTFSSQMIDRLFDIAR